MVGAGFRDYSLKFELISDFYLFRIVYPGRGKKEYPVIQPLFLSGIQFNNYTGLISKTIVFTIYLSVIFWRNI